MTISRTGQRCSWSMVRANSSRVVGSIQCASSRTNSTGRCFASPSRWFDERRQGALLLIAGRKARVPGSDRRRAATGASRTTGLQDRLSEDDCMRSRSSLSSLILGSVVLVQTRPRARVGRSRDRADCSHDGVSIGTGCAYGRASPIFWRNASTTRDLPIPASPDRRTARPSSPTVLDPAVHHQDRPHGRGRTNRSHAGPASPRSDFRRHARQAPAMHGTGLAIPFRNCRPRSSRSNTPAQQLPRALRRSRHAFISAMPCRRAARFGVSPITICS